MKICDYCGSSKVVKRYYFFNLCKGNHMNLNIFRSFFLSQDSYSNICSLCEKAMELKNEKIIKEIIEEKKKKRNEWIKERNKILENSK